MSEMHVPDDRLTLVGAILARYLEDGHQPTIAELERVGRDLAVPTRPLLHLLGYLPLASMKPRTSYRLEPRGVASPRCWHHGWDRASTGKAVLLDHSDPVSLNAWRVCRALHDTRPYFEVYDG